MEKEYTYENATVRIVMSDEWAHDVRTATENFLRKVIAEREGAKTYGDSNTRRIIREK
jgi:hypothetical protein